jgi:hypothetical protein
MEDLELESDFYPSSEDDEEPSHNISTFLDRKIEMISLKVK